MSDILPFGKYKGLPLTEVAARDSDYLEWCSQQDGLRERYPQFFQLVVNVLQPKTDDTPDHNEMQVRFLEDAHCLRVAGRLGALTAWEQRLAEKITAVDKQLNHPFPPAPNPDPNNYHYEWKSAHGEKFSASRWRGDDTLEQASAAARMAWHKEREHDEKLMRRLCAATAPDIENLEFEVEGWDVVFSVTPGFNTPENWEHRAYIELKTSVGADYPSVIRQIDGRSLGLRATKRYRCCIVKTWQGGNVTFEQAKKIFATKDIVLLTEAETLA